MKTVMSTREQKATTPKVNRRNLIKAGAALGAAATFATTVEMNYALGQSEEPVKIGWLGDRTGNFSNVGVQKFGAANLAVKELNDNGGILGREVVLVSEDAQSDNRRYQQMARKLILDDKVDVLHAGFTSASREAIRPLMSQNKMIYFYNNQYEGGVCDTWTFPTGSVPDHQVVPFIPAIIEKFGPRYYIIAADYNFGQLTAQWCRTVAAEHDGELLGEEFIPLDVSQFGTTISNIQAAAPDFLITLITGIAHSSFYEQKNAAGLDVPMATTINIGQGYEHLLFPPPALANQHVVVNFIQELDNPDAQDFVARYRDLNPDAQYVGMEAAAEWEGIHLYAAAAEIAGTTDREAVRDALETGVSVEGPSGTVTIDPDTHHTIRNMYMVHADEEHNIIQDTMFENVRPDWLSKEMGCHLPEKPDDTQYEPEG